MSGDPAIHAGRIIAHYEKHGRTWDADRRAAEWNDRPWHERFAAAVPPGGAVLDLGCGAGAPVAAHMAARGLRVTGVDASPTLIALCRERMPDQEWLVGDMRSVALARRFDGVLAWDSFFHLTPEDQRHMFGVFAAHAGPGAWLLLNTGSARGERVGQYRGDPLYYASLDPADYVDLLTDAGFRVVEHVAEDRATGGGRTVWLAQAGARPA